MSPMPMLVKDVMVRDVAYASLPGNRDQVLKTLQERQVSGVPVVKKEELVGMITRSDISEEPGGGSDRSADDQESDNCYIRYHHRWRHPGSCWSTE